MKRTLENREEPVVETSGQRLRRGDRAFSRLMTAAVWSAASGCGGDARVELAAADAMDAMGAALARAVTEYHEDLAGLDDGREREAVYAFVERVARHAEDDAQTGLHAEALLAALARVRADRQTEWRRYTNSLDNVRTMHEMAAGLRRLAIESMSLEDETRKYLSDVLKRLSKSQDAKGTDAAGIAESGAG